MILKNGWVGVLIICALWPVTIIKFLMMWKCFASRALVRSETTCGNSISHVILFWYACCKPSINSLKSVKLTQKIRMSPFSFLFNQNTKKIQLSEASFNNAYITTALTWRLAQYIKLLVTFTVNFLSISCNVADAYIQRMSGLIPNLIHEVQCI